MESQEKPALERKFSAGNEPDRGNLIERWWLEPDTGEAGMEDDHGRQWNKIIRKISETDLRDKSILDFGCNQGGFLRMLYKQRPFREGVGVDIATESIRTAKENAGDLPLHYVATDSLRQFQNQFDIAIASAVLFYLTDLEDHARQINAALRAGGVYYSTFANYIALPSYEVIKSRINEYAAVKMQDHTLDSIAAAFHSAGFRVEISRMPIDEYTPIQIPDKWYSSIEEQLQAEEESYVIFRFSK